MCKRFIFVPYGPKERSWSQWIETQGGIFQPQLFPAGDSKVKLAASADSEFSVVLSIQVWS